MATPAEIANDLEARAKLMERTHFKNDAMAMRRGAQAIRDLMDVKAQLEREAEEAHERWEREAIG
ncbi:hypothetical protein [Thalassococcus sp. S3]|uniref:hypothetical protein n=1 Tax=Thalassococcus sp. S3 TaxID=2017482 RepID=UPI0010242120|nr:hypothetical protein [Thalassococcus sp. S3]QBF31509.1 hypothetical protein CFI11_09810 [Thalassococcus sp. S3]